MIGVGLPVVSSLYDITQAGFYRYGNEIVEQCTADTPGEEMKWIYDDDGEYIGQAWSDKHGVMFRRNVRRKDRETTWLPWFIVKGGKMQQQIVDFLNKAKRKHG